MKTDPGGYTNQLNVSLRNGVVFETLFIPNRCPNDTLYVAFPCGGRSSGRTMFNYWSWSKYLNGDMLCVEDPSYKKIFSKRGGIVLFVGSSERKITPILSTWLPYFKSFASVLDMHASFSSVTRLVATPVCLWPMK